MINVLQAMILTDKEKIVLTPTYYLFKMYVPFQDATFVPVDFDPGTIHTNGITLPRADTIAAKDSTGKLWIEITNLDPEKPLELDAAITGISAKSARAETLTAPAVDSVNTFAAPSAVVPKAVSATVKDGRLALTVAPKSVTVISLEP
jgi:alpha-N-arabinofuranosidase